MRKSSFFEVKWKNFPGEDTQGKLSTMGHQQTDRKGRTLTIIRWLCILKKVFRKINKNKNKNKNKKMGDVMS
jgi:hypothetical protein